MPDQSTARSIIAEASAGSLGTLDEGGDPFVSLVTVAAISNSQLVMLLSGLARHTKNLVRHSGCSLLLVEPGGEKGDPLAGARLTLSGAATAIERKDDQDQRAAFLRKHSSASMYADFADFSFYQFDIHTAHLVAGFGRIETIPASQL